MTLTEFKAAYPKTAWRVAKAAKEAEESLARGIFQQFIEDSTIPREVLDFVVGDGDSEKGEQRIAALQSGHYQIETVFRLAFINDKELIFTLDGRSE